MMEAVRFRLDNGRIIVVNRDEKGTFSLSGEAAPSVNLPQAPEQESNEPSQSIAVEGRFIGKELQSFHLETLLVPSPSDDWFTHVYFKTESGNIYCIYKDNSSGQLTLFDARTNARRGNDLKGSVLSLQDTSRNILQLGESFHYGQGGQTSKITELVGVDMNRSYDPTSLEAYTAARTSSLISELKATIFDTKESE